MPTAGVAHFILVGILAALILFNGCGSGTEAPQRAAGNGQGPGDDTAAIGNPAPAGNVGSPPPAQSGLETVALAAGIEVEEEVPQRLTIETHLLVEEDVLIPARMTGIVEKIFVDRGSQVSKGQLLLSLRNRDLKLLVKRTEIVLKQAEADYARARRLHTERTISESEFEAVELGHEAVSVDLEIAREELERSMVRAPFSGLIIERFAKIGQKVIEEENPPLFRLSGLSPLHARLYLPERVARSLREGDEVEVIPLFDSSGPVTGRITWISPIIDASSGTSLAIVSIPSGGNSGISLQPGTAVSVTLHVAVGGSGIRTPASTQEAAGSGGAP